ncbi:alpha/beta hydrolase [Spirochaetota bacterium]
MNNKNCHVKRYFTIACAVIITGIFVSASGFEFKGTIKPGKWLRNLKVEYTHKGVKSSAKVQIYFPKGYEKGDNLRTIIALHDYSGSLRNWEKETNIEKFANMYKFIIVCPAMYKTVYETKFYPQTTYMWGKIPGGKFVGEVLINYLREEFGIAKEREMTGIVGASTGGRGAILLAATYNDTFGAATGLSGDYDSVSLSRTKRFIAVYGKYKYFKKRWHDDDNIMKLAVNLKDTPVYLYHGGKERAIRKGHSVLLAIRLRQLQKKHGGYEITYLEKKYNTHDWDYWRRRVSEFMDFFNEKLKK